MLRAAILSLLLSQTIQGMRIDIAKKNDVIVRGPETDETETGDLKEETCSAECGASTMKVGTDNFVIGEGDKITYEAKDSECLADCSVWKAGTSCGFGFTKLSKAKNKNKLCCKVKPCTYRVKLDDGLVGEWKEKLEGEMRLLPLQDFEGGEISRNSCFCCKEPRVPWNGNVNLKCKLGFGNTGSWWNHIAAAATFSIYDQVWKNNCEKYCLQYAGYTHAKKSFRAKVWVPASRPEDIPDVDGQAIAEQLMEDLPSKVEAGKKTIAAYKAAKGESIKDAEDGVDHSEEIFNLCEDLRDMLEQAGLPEVEGHMGKALLEDAKKTLKELDAATMPQQVMDAMEKLGTAYGLDNNDVAQKKALVAIIEEIEGVVSKATDYEAETEEAGEKVTVPYLKETLEMLDHLLVEKGLKGTD